MFNAAPLNQPVGLNAPIGQQMREREQQQWRMGKLVAKTMGWDEPTTSVYQPAQGGYMLTTTSAAPSVSYQASSLIGANQ